MQLNAEQPPSELSLIPNEHVSAKVIADAIEHSARNWQQEQRLSPALGDFFARRTPRLCSDQRSAQDTLDKALVGANEDLQMAVVRLVSALDQSTLCIQGPPGSGKTTIAAAAIVALVGQGKRIGITSNSHAAILNLMQKCNELQPIACIKVGGLEDEAFYRHWPRAQYVKSVRDAIPRLSQVGLIGGTAWAFSASGMQDKLDYLFVDEAGQVSVANLVGMAASTKNIVLLGDQMQLAQPIQGSHPGQSGQSSLAYLLQEQATIPETLGVFLGTSWRLHPRLCQFISDTMYDGRLQAAAHTAQRIVRRPGRGGQRIQQEAGLVFVPVEHEGNSQGSDEEVGVIQELVQDLLGRELSDETGQVVGQLGFEEMLFVAPYNMQVRKLQTALGPQARVGSVDKFQGQEAAVVIVSMCASRGGQFASGDRISVQPKPFECRTVTGTQPGYCCWQSCPVADPLYDYSAHGLGQSILSSDARRACIVYMPGSMKTFTRYFLLQIPDWLILTSILVWLGFLIDLPFWTGVGLLCFWVVKDFVLYPFVRSAYEPAKTGTERLVGVQGKVEQTLDPRGYVRIHGELWRAEAEGAEQLLESGRAVTVRSVRGLMLIVSSEEKTL